MKKILMMMMAVSSLMLTACLDDDEGYSLGKVWISLGEVESQGSGSALVRLDDGALLFPVAGEGPLSLPEEGTRILVNYTIVGDKLINETTKEYYIRLNSWREVLKKGIIDLTPAMEDSIGNDPVIVEDIWVSRNQLLNMELKYFGRNKVHFINLVKAPGALTSEDQPFELEFRHNDNGDDPVYSMNALVSFDLSALQVAGADSVRFRVKSVDYNDIEHIFNGVYRY
ncbi:MAG: NigD-like N-terminal domain-containing protein [Prolixibacteraceae bacterium]|nr:NigD-like N-terminal domain-containing protein [Prolixibacteraceae bacterium]HOY50748.1 NigD-like protein [Prolixibacteraceae bacterium]HPJ77644.1 NigD-like protein [Prolixibacteraceae bacterium]HRV88144.1 NigD-like protein [Prolixibacteraceae bacterium]